MTLNCLCHPRNLESVRIYTSSVLDLSSAPSGPPTNMQVPTIYSRQVELVWAAPPMDQQNGIIRRYIVNLTSDGSREELITYSQTTALVQNLHPFTTYFCSVSAETVAPGPFSPPIVIQTLEDGKTFCIWKNCNIRFISKSHTQNQQHQFYYVLQLPQHHQRT